MAEPSMEHLSTDARRFRPCAFYNFMEFEKGERNGSMVISFSQQSSAARERRRKISIFLLHLEAAAGSMRFHFHQDLLRFRF